MSTKVLLMLISAQTIPNLLIAQEKGPFDKYILLTTEEMQVTQSKTGNMINAIKEIDKGKEVICININEDDIEKTKDEIKKIIDKLKNKYGQIEPTFNFTNGTKQMAIALYNYAVENYKDSDILYSTRDLQYINYKGNSQSKPINYKTKLDIKTYLLSLGITDYINDTKKLYPKEVTDNVFNNAKRIIKNSTIKTLREVFNFEQDKYEINQRVYNELIQHYRENSARNKFESLKKFYSTLTNLGFVLESNKYITSKEMKYILGGWLEEYIYLNLPCEDKYKATSVFLNNKEFFNNKENEFDVVAIYQNKFYVFECKTAFDSILATNTNYKISALIKKFGSEDIPCIVYLSDYIKGGNIKFDLQRRAKSEKVKIMNAADVRNFPRCLDENLKAQNTIKIKNTYSSLFETSRIIKSK